MSKFIFKARSQALDIKTQKKWTRVVLDAI